MTNNINLSIYKIIPLLNNLFILHSITFNIEFTWQKWYKNAHTKYVILYVTITHLFVYMYQQWLKRV